MAAETGEGVETLGVSQIGDELRGCGRHPPPGTLRLSLGAGWRVIFSSFGLSQLGLQLWGPSSTILLVNLGKRAQCSTQLGLPSKTLPQETDNQKSQLPTAWFVGQEDQEFKVILGYD